VAERGDFAAAFASVARQAKVAFVCEGAPLHTTPAESQALRERLAAPQLPLSAAVRDLAEAFDYDAAEASPGLFVLTKRYSDADDLPPVTLDEAASALRGIVRAGAPFNPREDIGHALTRLLRVARPEQREALAAGVVLGALPPELNELGRRVAYSLHFEYSLSAAEVIARRLDACRHQRASFVLRPFGGGPAVPALEGPFAPNGGLLDISLTHPTRISAPGQATLAAARAEGAAAKTLDPTTPYPHHDGERRTPLDCERTLTQLADAAPGSIVPDAAVAKKRVSVFGTENVTPQAILDVAARLYGLRLAREAGAGGRLTLPAPRPLQGTGDVTGEVTRLLPPPFLRAVTARAARSEGADSVDDATGDALYIAAVRRLRERVEPALARSGGQPVPIAEVDPEAADLVAIAGLASTVGRMQRLMRAAPGFVLDPDHARLTVTMNGGTVTYTFMGADGSGVTGTAPLAAE
jgi:hypothetical protein